MVHDPWPRDSVALQENEAGRPVGAVGATTTVPLAYADPGAPYTVTLKVNLLPVSTLLGLVLLIFTVVAERTTFTCPVPEDALWVELPPYFAVMVLFAAVEKLALQCVEPLDRVPWHSLRVPSQNTTVPVGRVPPVTVADSFTLVPT